MNTLSMPPAQRVAAVHDLSGFGRTSLTVAIPIISSMGIQVCPLPTAVLSTHTTIFTDYTFLDLTAEIRCMLAHWQKLDLSFDAIYSGFLASADQMDTVAQVIATCRKPGGLAVVDPVLGDNGVLDPTMTPEMVDRMRWLVGKADVITPNFTEAAFLLNEPFYPAISSASLRNWLKRLSDIGPRIAVITSAPIRRTDGRAGADTISAVAFDREEDRFWRVDCPYVPVQYPGTGDTFASVLTGALLQGDDLPAAMGRAVRFVTEGIRATYGHGLPVRDGLMIERVLHTLSQPSAMEPYCALGDEE
jgi:pyridoxine kinase